jgi:hypothetical protein
LLDEFVDSGSERRQHFLVTAAGGRFCCVSTAFWCLVFMKLSAKDRLLVLVAVSNRGVVSENEEGLEQRVGKAFQIVIRCEISDHNQPTIGQDHNILNTKF